MELFHLGSNWASVWIREFREKRPDWLEWNSKTRSFHATAEAYRCWRGADPGRRRDAAALSRYLALVGLPYANTEIESGAGGLVAAFPDLSTPNPVVFAMLAEAIRRGRQVRLAYRSMGNPEPHSRIIAPHNLVRAGRRWHVRAYCETHREFRDYALGRIVDAEMLSTTAAHGARDDAAWQAQVPVRLVPHPGLSPGQADVIWFEYFNDTSARTETCRGALVGYFIQEVRAAVDTARQLPPDYQLAVSNIDEVKPWLFPS